MPSRRKRKRERRGPQGADRRGDRSETLPFAEIPAGGQGGPLAKHLRADLRLIRQAIGRGWLDDSDASKKAAIMAYLSQALDKGNDRAKLAGVWAILEAERANARIDKAS